MAFLSISGPTRTGKSTIISLLKDTLPKDTIYLDDVYVTVWKDLVDSGIFSEFSIMYKDREMLFIFISRVCKLYKELINEYKDCDKLVVMEGCYIDHLIYAQLNTWFHYPLQTFQEDVVSELLEVSHDIPFVFMTTANDENYPIRNDDIFDLKTTKTSFKRNRRLELDFYNIYRNWGNVVTLPQNLFSCDKIIVDHLRERGII